MIRVALMLLLLMIAPRGTTAAPVRIMVAANFRECLQVLTEQYTARTGVLFKTSHGGTGQLYAQIKAGAPCHLFFAADTARPQQLVADGLADKQDCTSYALGMLVLFGPGETTIPGDDNAMELVLDQVLNDDNGRLAIANPDVAPYGRAAVQVLQNIGRHDDWEYRLVRGQNVGQTWQFVHTGAAVLGFVAQSQIMAAERAQQELKIGTALVVPQELYDPIVQQVVVLRTATPEARAFLAYVFSPEGGATLRRFGYQVPVP